MKKDLTQGKDELVHATRFIEELKSENKLLRDHLNQLSSDDKFNHTKTLEDINYYNTLFEKSVIPFWEEDFSEVKLIIDQLHEQKVEDFEAYFDDHPDVVQECLKKVHVINVNEATLQQMEVENKEDLLKNLNFLLSDVSIEAFKKGLVALANNKTIFEIESHVTTTKNKKIYIQLRWSVFSGFEDSLERVLVSTEDISERHQAEVDLLQSEKKFRHIFNNATDAIYIQDKQGKFIDVNECAIRMYGYPRESFIGKTPDFLAAPDKNDTKEVLECFERAFNGETVQFDFWGLRKNGEVFPKIVRLKKIYYQNQDVVVAFAIDITARKKYEEGLLRAKNVAEESSLLKSEFLQNMSHEVKTPLNGILGFSELLCLPTLDDSSRMEYSQLIKRSAYQLARIMEDIMEISRLETKQVKVKISEVHMATLMKDINSLFIKDAALKNLKLTCKEPENCEDFCFHCDDVKLEKILQNLIENAIKYTDDGFVEFGYKLDGGNIVFHVRDTGIGIGDDKKDLIFRRFSQEDKGSTRSFGGLGLGLSIAKGNAHLLGGEIWLESQKGIGSTFYVSIPNK